MLTAQCLANSLWAVAKLGLRGKDVEDFAEGCLEEMCKEGRLKDFSTQGLANSLWAVARMQLKSEAIFSFCVAVARETVPERLSSFLPQELSMVSWAVARIASRGTRRSPGQTKGRTRMPPAASAEGEALVLAVTKEASARLGEFGPQGLSSIAWALATLALQKRQEAHDFLLAAALRAAPLLKRFPSQAIVNLSWAIGRMEGADFVVTAFLSSAAAQASSRMDEFEWQDLSSLARSLLHHADSWKSPEVRSFVSMLEDCGMARQAMMGDFACPYVWDG